MTLWYVGAVPSSALKLLSPQKFMPHTPGASLVQEPFHAPVDR